MRRIAEEEEQWSEKCERCWGSLVRHLGGNDSVMMGEEASDEWEKERGKVREREDAGEQLCCS